MERLRGQLGPDEVVALDPFDPEDDGQVDAAARSLLERFRRTNDKATFTLLFELTQPRLSRIAEGLTQRMAPSVDPDDLVSSFFASQFADLRDHHQPVRRFLGLANRSMRNLVLDHRRWVKRDQRGSHHYQDSLADPADPALQAADQEQDAHLARYGQLVARLTDECFHGLDERYKHVLVARELLGMSYERVAVMLQVEPRQVGMVIRRARQHLADRIAERLAAPGHEGLVEDEDVERVIEVVRRSLQSKERVKNVRNLVQRMLDESAAAGRRRLADLVYELAKTFLLSVPGLRSRMLVQRAPRDRRTVASDVSNLSQRLATVDESLDQAAVEGLARRQQLGHSALDDARQCLDVLASLEGSSGRQQVAVALHLIYSERLDEAETLLRTLLDADLPAASRQNVFRNLAMTLLRQERWTEAADVAELSADEWPDDPVQVMNLCYAAARMDDVPRFEENVSRLVSLSGRSPGQRVQSWIEGELPGLARDLGMAPDHFRSLLNPPGQASGSGAGS